MSARFRAGIMLLTIGGGCGGGAAVESRSSELQSRSAALLQSADESGLVGTWLGDEAAQVMRAPADHPFFVSHGTNGRACIHCHVPSAGWTLTPEVAQLRFTKPLEVANPRCLTDPFLCRPERDPARWGLDPLFRAVDGATSPAADVSTAWARLRAYRLLLEKGLIRIGIGMPAQAEFTLAAVDDPYHYASAAELSLFRRPLPATNLATGAGVETLSAIMWDGREADLATQADDAILGHAEATAELSPATLSQIVAFESQLHTAQLRDIAAGDLTARGAQGGPRALTDQSYLPGGNDPFSNEDFDADVFSLYQSWRDVRDSDRARVARGEALFNRRSFTVTGVAGLNDALGQDRVTATCSTCHDSPNYGHHSRAVALNIGIADGARRTPDLPLYTLRNTQTGERVQVTDPGRALITGKWEDIGKFKGPILRGLAARPPYFHNGSAASLRDVVQFYDQRFAIGLSDAEERDLVAFLRTL